MTTSRTSAQSLCVCLSGELDLDSAGELLELVETLSEHCVTLDLAELSFVDVAGMSALSGAIEHLAAAGAQVILRGARGPVRRVFALCEAEYLLEGLQRSPSA